MKNKTNVQSLVVYGLLLTVFVCRVGCEGTTVEKLAQAISSLQVTADSSFSVFPPSWQRQKGSYPNEVKLNFHGNVEYYVMREAFKVPDVNMFTPAWVTACLIEAFEYGNAPPPSATQLNEALHAIDKFRNRNVQYNNSEMNFWTQTWNKTADYYQSFPRNLIEFMKLPDYLPDKLLGEFLEKIGLKDVANVIKSLLAEKVYLVEAFHIPPDSDDTFVNIGVGSLLSQFQKDFPAQHSMWSRQNSNLTSVFEKVKKYAYRPFSNISKQNTIDTRTYMYLHTFLEKAALSNQNVALITTWLQDTDEVKTLMDRGVAMPFNVNNVDITVAANFMYGVVACVASQVCSLDLIDHDIQQIFMNSTALVVYEIQTNLSSRPELSLTYYPSKFEFYWFVSRTFALLNRFSEKFGMDNALNNLTSYAYTTLRPVMKNHVTNDVLRSINTMQGESFIDNFLGRDDVNLKNQTVNHAEDRLFSTAVSVNTLINIWTTLNNGTLHWDTDTPDSVKSAVSQMAAFLDRSILSSEYKTYNTFFSGSEKSDTTMPLCYPANRLEYFNGTKFTDKTLPSDLHFFIGMEGYVTPQKYAEMLRETHFGFPTPMTFNGYNDGDSFFPFWTSDAYTYATVLVALSHYENIV